MRGFPKSCPILPAPFLRALLLGLVLALTATSGVAHAQGPQYTFTRITDSVASPGLGSFTCVGLSNQGTVIVTFVPTGSDFNQVWRGDGQGFTQVTPRTNGLCASINDLDEIAYLTFDPPPSNVIRLVRASNGVETPLTQSDVFPFLSSQTPLPSLSNSGSAVFIGGGPSGEGPGRGIYVAPEGLTFATSPLFSSPVSMNDDLTVAFLGVRDDKAGIYREAAVLPPIAPGDAVPLIETGDVVPGGTIGISTARPVINNSGTVAFIGVLNGIVGVYSTADGASVNLLGTSPVDRISMNDSGAVVFRRSVGAGAGIYLGSPGLIDQVVIAQGEDIDGSTLLDAFIWEEALNDEGQVAFLAFLADGRVGIYRADPADETTINLSPASAINQVGTAHCVTAEVLDRDGSPLEGIRVDFTVTGPNSTTGFANSAVDGLAEFCYTGAADGVDTIVASVGNVISNDVTKTWFDNQPPDVTGAYPSKACFWPPNHRMATVSILGITDPDGDPVTVTITGITSDEATSSAPGVGGGNHAPDAAGVGTSAASIRVERSGQGDGRVYQIYFDASDGPATVSGSVLVGVHHDQRPAGACGVDSGQVFDAFVVN